MHTFTPGSGVPTEPAKENNTEQVDRPSGNHQHQGCERAAARLSTASTDCAGTKELPSRGVTLREGFDHIVCLHANVTAVQCTTFAEQTMLEMPQKTNVSSALNSLSWPAFEDISTAS